MRSAIVAASLAGLAAAWGPPDGSWGSASEAGPAYTTEVVTAFTTYCPEATEVTHNGWTYTATEATWLTISYTTSWAQTTWAETTPTAWATTPATTWATTPATTWATTPAPYPISNATTPVWSSPVASTATSYPSSPVPATGGAAQLSAAGAAIAAVFGLVAAL